MQELWEKGTGGEEGRTSRNLLEQAAVGHEPFQEWGAAGQRAAWAPRDHLVPPPVSVHP